jgi:hypothetical protein
MKPANHEGELLQNRFQRGDQPQLRDLWSRGRNLPLRHFVDGIDLIQAFAPLLISLMDGIDAQKAGLATWLRFAPFADRNRRRPRGLIAGVALPVRRGVAQSIEVRHRDRRQPHIRRLRVVAVFPLENPSRRRSA